VLEWQEVPDAGVFDWRTPVRDRLAVWTPGGGEAALWEDLGPWLVESVERADPVSARMATDALAALWQVALFCERQGLGRGPRVWLAGHTLQLFRDKGRPDLSPASRAGLASRVRGLGHPVPLSGRDVFTPYRPGQLAALWAAAGAHSAAARRRDARVLLALCAGAGLTAAEAARVRAHDVRPAGAAVVLAVRGRGQRRMVIVRRAFEHTLAEAAHAHTGQVVYLLAPTRFNRTGIAARITGGMRVPAGCPRPATRRLRATWLAELAEARIPLPVLAAAAGIEDLGRLTRLLRHLDRPEADTAADALRDG
jgi:hypothetical protein